MQGLVASLLDALWRAPDAAVAALLLALPALGLRSLLRAGLDRGAPRGLLVARLFASGCGLGAGWALVPLGWASLAHTRAAGMAASLAFVLVLLSVALPSLSPRFAVTAGTAPVLLIVLTGLVSALALLKAGFSYAATGETLVVVEVTGESHRAIVRFAPPGLPAREEGLRAERLLLSRGDGTPLGEAWVFGQAATFSGERFRLRTWSGASAWLGRFDTAANDAHGEDGRPRLYPAQTTGVEPLGRGGVPGFWRERQRSWLLALGLEEGPLVSPPLPLRDAHGLTLRAAHGLAIRDDGTLALGAGASD